jgi:hypothetical protein
MVADREEVGEEVAAEGTSLAEGVTKTMGQTMIQGVAITPMVRTIPATMGETLGIDLTWCHASPRVIPMIW